MKSLWLMLLLLSFGCDAHADRDIVYAARYYTPPGSHRASHFHLYRVNPDGTGNVQLTFGAGNDGSPRWSPDGKSIAFVRDGVRLCVISSDGGDFKAFSAAQVGYGFDTLRWLPGSRLLAIFSHQEGDGQGEIIDVVSGNTVETIKDMGECLVSPDGRHAYLGGVTRMGQIVSLKQDGQIVAYSLTTTLDTPAWMDGNTLVGFTNPSDQPADYELIDCQGRIRQRGHVRMSNTSKPDNDTLTQGPSFLLSIPGDKQRFLYASNQSNSTDGTQYDFYEVQASTGCMAPFLATEQFVSFCPDGSRFCTAPGRSTTPYEKGARDNYRTVWSAPLYLRATRGGPMRQLTPRLSWVTAADWRKRN